MTITISLADIDGGGTDVLAVHERLPPGVPILDNEAGWRDARAKLPALVEAGYLRGTEKRRWITACRLCGSRPPRRYRSTKQRRTVAGK